jgi:16S rRNA (adenine1518-N6/adenine1519-N6)-dimethyltransferase
MKNLFHTENFKPDKKNIVRAKKHLGQHFLKDETIALNIVKAFTDECKTKSALEIGPGMGVLTKYLLEQKTFEIYAIDIDKESIIWLKEHFPSLENKLIEGDFLNLNLGDIFKEPFSLIGNFPYNISSQIVFKIIENKNQIPLMVGMFQKEVAERFSANPCSKAYGILSVLTQAYYHVEYLFTVSETVFDPPPKVKSGVIRLKRRETDFDVPEKMLFKVVKAGFNQRRKKLRNALSQFNISDEILKPSGFSDKRAEELSVQDFVTLTHLVINNSDTIGK